VLEAVEGLDLGDLERAYAGKGSAAYHRALLLSLLICGYANGCYSSRKIEQATYDSLAFRYIACNRHPDHDALASFRKRFGNEFEGVLVEVLQVVRENQLSRFGRVSLDGTKIHATASRHSALSYGHAEAIEAQLAVKRDEHHPHYSERFSEPPELPANPTPVQRMTHRLKTGAGKAAYALRKSTVEPVFGIIKSVLGFRQFLTRGLDNVQGEWTLVCLAWNLKRMAVLRPQ
jgi:transposase